MIKDYLIQVQGFDHFHPLLDKKADQLEKLGRGFIKEITTLITIEADSSKGLCVEGLDTLLKTNSELKQFIFEHLAKPTNQVYLDIESLKCISEDIDIVITQLIELMGYHFPKFLKDPNFQILIKDYLPQSHPHRMRFGVSAKALALYLKISEQENRFKKPSNRDTRKWNYYSEQYGLRGSSLAQEYKELKISKGINPEIVKQALVICGNSKKIKERLMALLK